MYQKANLSSHGHHPRLHKLIDDVNHSDLTTVRIADLSLMPTKNNLYIRAEILTLRLSYNLILKACIN